MAEHDWESIRRAKERYRDRMAELPFEEKLRMLERLRDRTMAVAGSWLSIANPRVPVSNGRVLDLRPTAQVGQNASSNANVGLSGARATLAAAVAANAALQSGNLSVSILKRD
jgi:hypothetical protein